MSVRCPCAIAAHFHVRICPFLDPFPDDCESIDYAYVYFRRDALEIYDILHG